MGLDYNRNYFKEIDTEEKAYWLGYIMGDGHVDERRVCFECNVKDLCILESLADCVEFPKSSIYFRESRNSCYMTFSCKKMAKDLERHGIPIGNKTETSRILRFNKDTYNRAFMCGLNDADGCFYEGKNRLEIYLTTGTKSLAEDFGQALGIGGHVSKSRNVFAFRKTVSRYKDMMKVYNYFYKDATWPYLPRKNQKLFKTIWNRMLYEAAT